MILVMVIILFFLLGGSLASFACNVSYRLQHGLSFMMGRSTCEKCETPIKWHDLLPVFGFLLVKGKCRNCHTSIPLKYFLVEILTGIITALAFLSFWQNNHSSLSADQFSVLAILLFYLWAIGILLFISVYDIDTMYILDKVIFPSIAVTLLLRLLLPVPDLVYSILAACLNAALIGAIVLLTRGKGMGMGDIKLAFLLGLIAGWPHNLTALLLAFICGALFGIGLVLLRRKNFTDAIPFGPFLSLGGIIALIYGPAILDWYLSSFIII